MIKNKIETIKKETKRHFKGSEPCDYPMSITVVSPSKNYFFQADFFQKKTDDGITSGNYYFTKIAVFDNETKAEIGNYLTNNGATYSSEDGMTTIHSWLEIDGKEYLFLPETKHGISVFDLTNRTLHSFEMANAYEEIVNFYPSHNGLYMAVLLYGHFPKFRVAVYDLSNPTVLPYKEIFTKNLDDHIYVEKIECNNGNVNIIYSENHSFSTPFLKVKIQGTTDVESRLRCEFQDIRGTTYMCSEKNEAMLDYVVDENTPVPIDSFVNADVVSYRTENGRKIYKISGDISYDSAPKVGFIEVFEEQIEFRL